jgi:transcriptional regulator with XRE-family HTH domain
MSNIKSQMADNSMESRLHDYRLKMGETIRGIREKRGYSQEQLAEIMQISRTTISKIENGRFAISIDYLVKFGWYLNFDIDFVDKLIK